MRERGSGGEGAVREGGEAPLPTSHFRLPTSVRGEAAGEGRRDNLRRWLGDPEDALFLFLLLLHLVPLWAFEYFPSQDGPAHLNNARILGEYFRPESDLLREYFALNARPDPNWFGHLILAALMLLAPPLIAEKILLSAYVILLPLSVRYAARALRPDAGFLAVLAFPFVYSYPLHMGFYYFCFSLAVFFFTFGYWLRHQERFGLREGITLAGLWLLLYFTHLVSLVTAWLAIGFLALWLTLLDLLAQARRREWDLRALGRALVSRLLLPLLACLPAFLLLWSFLGQTGLGEFTTPEMGVRLRRLWRLESLVSFLPAELWPARILVWLFLAAVLYLLARKVLRREPSRWDGLLLVVLGYIAIYSRVPDAMGSGAYLSQRLMLYSFFALLLWFAAQRWGAWGRQGVQWAAACIALVMLGLHATTYLQLNRYLREYTAAAALIEPNSTLLALSFSHWGDAVDARLRHSRIGVFFHASGYIGAEGDILALHNYEANTVHFPLRFRREVNPYLHISRTGESIEAQPPAVDFLTYPERTGGRVDYVLLWAPHEDMRTHPEVISIFQQLDAAYELIYTSPRGLTQLYRNRK